MQLDLDLKAKVLPFPPHRMIDRVRAVAQHLDRMSASKANNFWRDVVADLRSFLALLNVDEIDSDRMVAEFFDAVQEEIANIVLAEQQGYGGVA